MPGVNKVVLIGRVGKDPEVRNTQAGQKIVTVSIATSEVWKDRSSGERKEKTEWHRVVVFNERSADFVEQYVRKGALLYVEGKLATRKWVGQDGVEKYSTEIVVENFNGRLDRLDKPDDAGGEAPARAARPAGRVAGVTPVDLDDEIPF